VTRERDASDGRIARVRITREGAALLRRGRSRRTAYLARRLQRLDPEQLEILERAAGLLEQLIEDDEERV
jgi:DNA-binding MarR family transcriptional regulator